MEPHVECDRSSKNQLLYIGLVWQRTNLLRSSMYRSRVWFALALAAISCSLVITPAFAAPVQPEASWSPCHRDFGFPFECSTVQVPLDHTDPGGAAISLALIRLPASDPARRIGSLFLNPGGPGGSGFDFALFLAPFLYSNEVRARFDIVGFDPRGIGRSTALRCFGTLQQAFAVFAPFPFPVTADEEAIWQQSDQALDSACDQRGGRIRDHMSTADVVRDLDFLRQAVGDDQLTYAGYSYGSFIGVSYANLFPHNVRALVVDGVLDPIQWATGTSNGGTVPFSTRLRSDVGSQLTFSEFFRLCDSGGMNCAFSPNASARFGALAAKLRATPNSDRAGRIHVPFYLCRPHCQHTWRDVRLRFLAASRRVPGVY